MGAVFYTKIRGVCYNNRMRDLLSKTHSRVWLAIVGVATILLVASYTMIQQSTRLAADDLPLATAQTVKHELESESNPANVVSAIKTNLALDNTVFVIVTDNSQHVLASSAVLDGDTPLPPSGVFSYALAHGMDHFTWQPKSGVRLATRVLTYADTPSAGFVITGQSLAQPEKRVTTYGLLALAAWVAIVAWASFALFSPFKPRK